MDRSRLRGKQQWILGVNLVLDAPLHPGEGIGAIESGAQVKPVDRYEIEHTASLLRGSFQRGRCMAFAVVVGRRTGWTAVSLRDSAGRLVHCGLRHPDGGFFDSRGRLTEDQFLEGWHGDLVDDTVDAIQNQYPTSNEQLRVAAAHAHMLFPDLPGVFDEEKKLDAFASELGDLCRRHGIFLRSDGPHGIVAYPAYGNEQFEAQLSVDGGFRVHRVLGPDIDDEPVAQERAMG